jgi:glycosyltransferase involved in cell wall biosynthesis
MKKVSILSTFYSIDRSYSLTTVVEEQIKMLVENGYDVDVIVTDTFGKPDGYFAHPKVTLKFIPDCQRSNEGDLKENYQDDVKKIEEKLDEALKGVDVCLTHDVIYQPAHIIFNLAARNIAKRRMDLRWLHWIHSATSPRIRCNTPFVSDIIQSKFPNSFIVYPNAGDIPRVARNFKYEEDEVKSVHHATDIPDYLGFNEWSKKIYRQHKFEEADIIATYPIRLDRGKQVEHVIKTLGAIKRLGRQVRGVIMDFASTGGDKVDYRKWLHQQAKLWDVEKEIIFTSEFDKELEYSCPREMVRDFMMASNLFILPSTSETYSLIAQEAMICKNFIVLNRDFPPMRSVWGDTPLYKQFSSAINALDGQDGSTTTKHDNEMDWYKDLGLAICYYIDNNPSLKMNTLVRKTRNSTYIFKNQLEPLFYAE